MLIIHLALSAFFLKNTSQMTVSLPLIINTSCCILPYLLLSVKCSCNETAIKIFLHVYMLTFIFKKWQTANPQTLFEINKTNKQTQFTWVLAHSVSITEILVCVEYFEWMWSDRYGLVLSCLRQISARWQRYCRPLGDCSFFNSSLLHEVGNWGGIVQ